MNIRLIALDLDGTLLDSDKNISERTIFALKRCKEKGIKIVLVTARSFLSSVRAGDLVEADLLVVNGGAEIRRGNETLFSLPISKALANEIKSFAVSLKSCYRITAESVDGQYLTSSKVEYGAQGDYSHSVLYPLSKPFETDMFKLVIYITEKEEQKLFRETFQSMAIYSYVGTNAHFIADQNVHKWNGLAHAADILGISYEQIVAFGDDIHDIEMIEKSGIGVAMGNAVDQVKIAADYTTCSSDNDGIAAWLEEYLI